MQLFPRVLSPDEVKVWGLPEMIPIFPTEEVLAIESKWSKEDLQKMAVDYFLSPEGDKDLLVRKLVYIGALDKDGELTGLPVGELAQQVPYVMSDPRKFCCRLCGACAPENLLKRGLFLDRIAWLREHYKVAHPGKWGKREVKPAPAGLSLPSMPGLVAPQIPPLYSSPVRQIKDRLEKLRKSDPEMFYRELKQIRDAIKERERGKIKKFPHISLTELQEIKKDAEALYR